MSPSTLVLLYMGLSLGPSTQGQAGMLPKPRLWAEPASEIPLGTPVTLWCEGTLEAQEYGLFKEGNQASDTQIQQKATTRADFPISAVRAEDAGRYRCYYHGHDGRSEPSEALELVVVPEALAKPRLWTVSGSVVPQGAPAILWCEWVVEAQECLLVKEGSPAHWETQTSEKSMNTATFSIPSTTEHDAGRYRCYYRGPQGWSEPSDALELVVTGFYRKPSLSVLPSPRVTSERYVTLQCQSSEAYDRFILTKEGGDKRSWTLDSQPGPSGQVQAQFHVGPVTPSQKWTFRCYGCYRIQPQVWSEPSDALEFLVPGTLPRPSFWAEPCCVIPQGEPVALWCEGTLEPWEYYVDKEGWPAPWDRLTLVASRNRATLSIPSVTEHHAGRYHCFYHSPAGWSQPSELLELVVTGVHSKPSLSALPSTVVTSGGHVTFLCGSQLGYDSFILTEESGSQRSWRMDSQHHRGSFQALFPVGPVVPNHTWTFRCYGYFRNEAQVWSEPSHALELLISGPHTQDYTVGNLIRMGLAGLLLVVLGILLLEAQHGQKRTQGAARK